MGIVIIIGIYFFSQDNSEIMAINQSEQVLSHDLAASQAELAAILADYYIGVASRGEAEQAIIRVQNIKQQLVALDQ